MSAIDAPLLAKARPLTLADVEPPGHTLLVAFVLAFAVIYTCLSFYLVCLAPALAWLPVGLGLQLIWRCGSSKSASPMAPKDRIWLCDTPTQPMIVNAVLVFEAPRLKLDRVTELIQERIIGHPALGRFSQLLQQDRRSPTGYVWATDPDFDVRRHIGEAVGEGACVARPPVLGAVASRSAPLVCRAARLRWWHRSGLPLPPCSRRRHRDEQRATRSAAGGV